MLEVPQILRPVAAETESRRAIGRGWEGLLRLGASLRQASSAAESRASSRKS
jgi:hypothetical protein